MKLRLESTTKIVEVNGVPARIWEGHTESGIACHAFITRLAVLRIDDRAQFDAELQEMKAPSAEVKSYPLRLIL